MTSPSDHLGELPTIAEAPGTEPSTGRATLADTTIDGRYEVRTLLGSGGMGAVYAGRQLNLDRPVAIKVLRSSAMGDEESRRRFLVEARATAAIQHPNVVEIIDFGELPGGSPYLVMEKLPGQDLQTILNREGRLRWSQARGIILQILAGLEAAHRANVLHRDIKPSNVLVMEGKAGERVKLVDFGIARFVDPPRGEARITAESMVVGTLAYLAPELLKGADPSPTTEVFSVGVLAYRALTGHLPFSERGFTDDRRRGTVPDLQRHCPDITAEVAGVIVRAVSKDPAERYRDIAAMEAALRSLDAAGKLAPSGPTGTALPTRRPTLERSIQDLVTPPPRRRGVLPAVILVALVGVVGIAAWWWQRPEAAPEPTEVPAVVPAAPDEPPPPPSPTADATPTGADDEAAPERPDGSPLANPFVRDDPHNAGATSDTERTDEPATAPTTPPSKPPRRPPPDATVLARLRQTMQRHCMKDSKYTTDVKLTVGTTGEVLMVRVDRKDDACLKARARAAKFRAGDSRVLTVTVGGKGPGMELRSPFD